MTVVSTIAGVIYTKTQIPLYRTSSMVRFEPPGSRSIGIDLMNWDQYAAMTTQARIISSAEIAQLAAKKLGNPQLVYAVSASLVHVQPDIVILRVIHGSMEWPPRSASPEL